MKEHCISAYDYKNSILRKYHKKKKLNIKMVNLPNLNNSTFIAAQWRCFQECLSVASAQNLMPVKEKQTFQLLLCLLSSQGHF